MFLLALSGFIFYAWSGCQAPTGYSTPIKQTSSCGMSDAEAIERKCVFNPITLTWQAPPCFNAELVGGFLSSKAEEHHRHDRRLPGVQSTITERKDGSKGHIFLDIKAARKRCAFFWTEMHHGRASRTRSALVGVDWVLDCSETLMGWEREDESVLIKTNIGFGTCTHDI